MRKAKTTKLLIGPKIRTIRISSELTQSKFAERLNISTSYLNQLENNQRHATASVLMSLAQNFSVDIRTLSNNESERMLADIMEATRDQFFQSLHITKRDLKLAISNTPNFVRAFLTLHESHRSLKEYLTAADHKSSGLDSQLTPYEEVRDFYHYEDNYFDELDKAGEKLAQKISTTDKSLIQRLTTYIEENHGIRVKFGGLANYPMAIRRFDRETKVLYLNPHNRASTHAFQIAHQIGLIEQSHTIESLAKNADFHSENAKSICKIGLANYFAGSLVLPYGSFFNQANLFRYDLELLADYFQTSVEQVAHRLSTLQRPNLKGIPFFFARVDQAGNITKRHSATKLQFARYGSACPLWNVHQAFEASGRIIRQFAETPDGEKYLCIAKAITIKSGGFRDPVRRYALALGCEIKYIDNIIYGDELKLDNGESFEPIGISCRICERKKCHQRSVPPLRHVLKVEAESRDIIPYDF